MDVQFTEQWLPGPSKTDFYTRTYGPSDPKAVIIFIHGFATHVGRFTELYKPIVQHGIAVFAFDQRGYGQTVQGRKKGTEESKSVYGKTTWKDQMRDIAWAVEYAKNHFEGKPLFLMGYSVGGTAVLSFVAQNTRSPHRRVVSFLQGVIAISPVIQQTIPVSRLQRWVGSKVSLLIPYIPIALPTKPDELSHNEAYNNAWLDDKLVKQFCPLKSLMDMLRHGDALLKTTYKNWPESLPFLVAHGTADKIASCGASQEFVNKVSAPGKIALFEDKFHALMIEDGGKLGDEISQMIQVHQPLSQKQPSAGPNIAVPVDPLGTGPIKAIQEYFARRRRTY